MIKYNDKNIFSTIVCDILKRKFKDTNYAYVEHVDTNIFHYHAIVEAVFKG